MSKNTVTANSYTSVRFTALKRAVWGVMLVAGVSAAVLGLRVYSQPLATTAQVVRGTALPWFKGVYQSWVAPDVAGGTPTPLVTNTCVAQLPNLLSSAIPLDQNAQASPCIPGPVTLSDTPSDGGGSSSAAVIASDGTNSGSDVGTTSSLNVVSSPITTPTIAPVSGTSNLRALTDRTNCPQGITLNVIAHEDDDLLFMNPDVQTDIAAGRCMRTLFMTAGDAGDGHAYWAGRERGSKASYAAMYGVANKWIDVTEMLDGHSLSVSYLDGVPQAALTFLRLPDGNLRGEGFNVNNGQSLQKLIRGETTALRAVDGQNTYKKQEIIHLLTDLMQTDHPSYIRTQNPAGEAEGDHADHAATGELTSLASAGYSGAHTLATYMGYPERSKSTNLTPGQISAKQLIFLIYAKHDGAVCHSSEECAATATYGSFLTREYKIAEVASGQ